MGDATAAFKVWMKALQGASDIPINDTVRILRSAKDIKEEMQQSKNNLISMSLPEYAEFDGNLFCDEIILGGSFSAVGVYYVLLVHQDSGIFDLKGLEDKKVIRHEENMTHTSDAWFRYLLAADNHPPASEFLAEYYEEDDLAQSVLPVFFGKAAACIVSEQGFSVMGELNPQIRQKLRVVARSPKSMPLVMVLQKGFDEELKKDVLESMQKLHKMPEGRQVLMMFKEESINVGDKGMLDEALETYRHWIEVADRS